MSADITTFDPLLKEYYTKHKVEDLSYEGTPFYAKLTKDKSAGGDGIVVPVVHGAGQGRSAGFSEAQTGATNSSALSKQFKLGFAKDYQLAIMDGPAMRRTMKDEHSFMKLSTLEINQAIKNLSRTLERKALQDGWGSVGQIASSAGISGSTITLQNIDDATNFEIGMRCVFSSSLNAATLRNTGGTTVNVVTKVNRITGVITFSAAISSVTGTANSDYVFVSGDRQDSATPSQLCILGAEAWNPYDAPSGGENFNGVDRSVDPTRLAGTRLDGTGKTAFEGLIDLMAIIARESGEGPSDIYSHHSFFQKAAKISDWKTEISESENGRVGIRGLKIIGPEGEAMLFATRNCPSDRVRAMCTEDWTLFSTGEPIELLSEDGLTMRASPTADTYESRWFFQGNLGCHAPVRQGVLKVTST